MIEVQGCKSCNRRCIGPDCHGLGLFNWNNRVIFTHDLLDEYTSAFTSSETPFVAWITVVSRRYVNYHSTHPFVSEDVFRNAWFAYAKLQHFGEDMACPTCGPSPENTIWDGITLAFNRKHLLPSLQPPTTTNNQSPIRDKCRYMKNQQCIIDKDIRKLIRVVITSRSLTLKHQDPRQQSETEAEDTEDTEAAPGRTTDDSQSGGLRKHAEAVMMAIEKLRDVDQGAVDVFTKWYGPEALVRNEVVPTAYKQLFLQVGVVCCSGALLD
jgi:hypothetical protein